MSGQVVRWVKREATMEHQTYVQRMDLAPNEAGRVEVAYADLAKLLTQAGFWVEAT